MRRATVEALVCGVATVTLLLLIVARDYPMIGHDHRYYIPRLLDTELHLRNNGYSAVQWYTPTFGGGVPAFPNPQHLQHSVLQLLTAFVNPWLAIQMTTAIASLAGFVAFRRFLQDRFAVAATPSTFGAVLFVGNGFYIEHMIVGHVGFQLFPLAAAILYALTDPHHRVVRNGAIIALIVSAMLFHAGIYQIILIALTCLLVLPLVALVGPTRISVRRLLGIGGTAAVFAAAIGSAKVHAVLAFMRQFPREIADEYNVGLLQGLAGLVLQLTGAMTVAPLMPLVGVAAARLEGALSKLTGASVQVGMWDLDTSLSPALWIVLGVALLAGVRRLQAAGMPRLDRREKLLLMGLGVATWILIEATLARGLAYPVIKELPVLRSLHVNHRIASVFIVPLIMIAARVMNNWPSNARTRAFVAGLLVLAVLSPLAYLLFPARVHQRSFDVSLSIETDARIRAGEQLAVSRIADVTDAEALAIGASSYRTYEPLFGYGLEAFAAETVVGDVRQVRDRAFNLTNPAGLVFPQENGLRPFERIAAADAAALDAFVSRGITPWRVPAAQPWLNWVSITGVIVALTAATWPKTHAARKDD